MADAEKVAFLKHELIPILRKLEGSSRGTWGVLNAQQMVEHYADSVKIASGKLQVPAVNSGERLEKSREFMLSDQPFKENIKNPLMSETAAPAKAKDMEASLNYLQKELDFFFEAFEKNPALETSNPFFGHLNFEQNVHLLQKHAMHHLRQFSLV